MAFTPFVTVARFDRLSCLLCVCRLPRSLDTVRDIALTLYTASLVPIEAKSRSAEIRDFSKSDRYNYN